MDMNVLNKFKWSNRYEITVDIKIFIFNRKISLDTFEAANCQVPDFFGLKPSVI